MPRPKPHLRADYAHLRAIPTRWADNDAYGHVNNSVYYFYFDTLVNTWLIEQGVLDIAKSPVIGFVVETSCQYYAPLKYPEVVTGALRVAEIGRSSVRYEIALFGEGAETAAAQGHFVHVYVDRETQKPVSVPEAMRSALAALVRKKEGAE